MSVEITVGNIIIKLIVPRKEVLLESIPPFMARQRLNGTREHWQNVISKVTEHLECEKNAPERVRHKESEKTFSMVEESKEDHKYTIVIPIT